MNDSLCAHPCTYSSFILSLILQVVKIQIFDQVLQCDKDVSKVCTDPNNIKANRLLKIPSPNHCQQSLKIAMGIKELHGSIQTSCNKYMLYFQDNCINTENTPWQIVYRFIFSILKGSIVIEMWSPEKKFILSRPSNWSWFGLSFMHHSQG